MPHSTSRVPLLVIAAIILVVATIGQIARDEARGFSLGLRILLPILGLSLAFLLFVGVLRFVSRQGRQRIRKLRSAAPDVVMYTTVNTLALRDAIHLTADGVSPGIELSPHPTLQIGVDGISLWGDDRLTGEPACIWSAPWSEVGDVDDGEFNDHGIRHRAVHVAIGESGDVPFVLVREDLGGFAVGRKTIEEFKRILRAHSPRASTGTSQPGPQLP
ncbi:hypothetical protein [Microterricola gilva]|uniref:hypothetical protein n=1 Tax=Microterricola gilva TaxID=393267 RepID=UPI0013EE5F43|nr:hypothetical protein [Microterricola gilva]